MNELALFAGAGGGILGGLLLGWRTRCAVEIGSYTRSVLLARQRDGILKPFPIWDDVRTFDGRRWRGSIDVVSGGFPCQAFSTAARGKNNAPDLSLEMLRVVSDVAPRFVFAENVSRDAIEALADELETMGHTVRCLALSAKDLGADHIRPRYWLLAHSDVYGKLPPTLNAKAQMLPGVCEGVWRTYPDEPRMVDGVSNRMDRIEACGNAQVPIVAALAWQILSGEYCMTTSEGTA